MVFLIFNTATVFFVNTAHIATDVICNAPGFWYEERNAGKGGINVDGSLRTFDFSVVKIGLDRAKVTIYVSVFEIISVDISDSAAEAGRDINITFIFNLFGGGIARGIIAVIFRPTITSFME